MGDARRNLREGILGRHPELRCFSTAVGEIALSKGLRKSEVIAASGLSAACFYHNTRRDGGNIPSLGVFCAVADGLGVTPEELLAAMRAKADGTEREAKTEGRS